MQMDIMKREQQEGIRINKYLSEAGICSRRAADREIENGNVWINGRQAVNGDRVLPGMKVIFCGKEVHPETEEIMIAFHKPVGIVCTAEKREKQNIIDFINYPKRIYPVGRLDKDSEGLILLTNQGDLVNKMMRAGNYHEKEYVVTVDQKVTPTESPNITYIRWLSQPELAERISQADLCLAGHFNKENGKANRTIPGKAYIYEAMKKPMILGDNAATRERYTDGMPGITFVEMGSPEALRDGILQCMKESGYTE